MLTLKDAFAKGVVTRVWTRWDDHVVVIQEVGPVGYELWVDGRRSAAWKTKLMTPRHLATGIILPSSKTLMIPEDHE